MWLLREKLSDFVEKQILHRVDIALYVHPKNSIRTHLRAIMALDHSTGVENKPGRSFSISSTSLLYKFLPINLGACKQTFCFFIHHIWGERVLRGAVFIIQTSTKCSNSQFFKTNCIHSIFKTIEARVDFYWQFKKFPKSPIRPAGSNFWQAPNLRRNFKRVTLQRDREFIEFYLLLMVL